MHFKQKRNLGYYYIVLGGDAFLGMEHAGHYYLGDKSNHYTEVSKSIYTASLWNGRSQIVAGLLGGLLLLPSALRRNSSKRAA